MKKLFLIFVLILLLIFTGCSDIQMVTSSTIESEEFVSSDTIPPQPYKSKDFSDDYIPEIIDNNKSSDIGYTTTEKILGISQGMTYENIINHLGVPETAGFLDGYVQYIVDGDKFLSLHFSNADEICLFSANEILKLCVAINTFFSDYKSCVTDALVIDITGSFITIATPGYKFFSVATFVLPTKYETITLNVGEKIRITHEDKISTMYPPRIRIVDISL